MVVTTDLAALYRREKEFKEAAHKARPPSIDVAPGKSAGWIASEASRLVGGERQETHGDKGVCFRAMGCADEFLSELREQAGADRATQLERSGVESALRMILYKMCRVYSGKHNLDDFVDMAGYAACAGEIADSDAS